MKEESILKKMITAGLSVEDATKFYIEISKSTFENFKLNGQIPNTRVSMKTLNQKIDEYLKNKITNFIINDEFTDEEIEIINENI